MNNVRRKISLKKVQSRYNDCFHDIHKYFALPDKTEPDAVHDLRVNLKKVDALIALLRFNKLSPSQKKLKAFKTLFKTAGKLRSVQVEFEIINKYFKEDANPNYLHQLHETKEKRLREYSKLIESTPKSLKQGTRTLKKKLDQITKQQILSYLKSEEKNLERRLTRSIFREQELHFVRKDLKRFHINLQLSGLDQQPLDKLLELLGAWHDHQIAFDHIIKAIYIGRLSESESAPIKKIKGDLINDKEDLYEKIVSFYALNMQNRR